MNHKNVAAVERAIHAAASSNRGVVYNDYTPEARAAVETVFDDLIAGAEFREKQCRRKAAIFGIDSASTWWETGDWLQKRKDEVLA